MAGDTGVRPETFQAVLVLMVSFLFAIMSTMITSVAAAARGPDSPALILGSRHVSPFVRKHLEAGLNSSANRQHSGLAAASRSYQYAMMTSGSDRARRLAGSANCSSNPSICNSTSFPAGAVCCLASGTCVDLKTDRTNCGICKYSCAPSLGCCDGTCVSTLTDNANCGTCGTTCRQSLCAGGMCGYGG